MISKGTRQRGKDTAAFAKPNDFIARAARAIAHRLACCIRGRGTPSTLDATALVHEAYLRLRPCDALRVNDEQHFVRLAARAMRQVLAREACARTTFKRGRHVTTVPFHDDAFGRTVALAEILTVEDALQTLDRVRPRQARVVRCRGRNGLSVKETAEALGISTATVKRDWRAARAWLVARLTPAG
jgi:RNA polymerase sigma factor (TIGR02999 family)